MSYVDIFFCKKFEEREWWTAKELTDEIGLSRQFVHRMLKKLVAKKRILKFGEAPKTVYSIRWRKHVDQYLTSKACSDSVRVVAGFLDFEIGKNVDSIYYEIKQEYDRIESESPLKLKRDGGKMNDNESKKTDVNGTKLERADLGITELERVDLERTKLMRVTKVNIGDILAGLLMLRMNHCIEEMPGGRYRLRCR